MKKVIILVCLAFVGFTILNVSAEEITYENIIKDTSTIEEDFELLNMNIENYHIPNFDYKKWYVIAISESYLENNQIQTYLYLYNPTLYNEYFPNLTFTYSINNKENKYVVASFLQADFTRSLYKIKGFVYDYTKSANIEITKIDSYYLFDGIESINSGEDVTEEYSSTSGFKSTNSHSLVDNILSIELNYNSTLVIDSYKVVEIDISQDSNLINWWISVWNHKTPSVLAYFYNFNFPDNIKPDSIEYAKFKYTYLEIEEIDYINAFWGEDSYVIKTSKNDEYDYYPGDNIVQVNGNSQELTFPTFYLGNRIADNQFGTWDMSNLESLFEYDCSILLTTTAKVEKEIIRFYDEESLYVGTQKKYTTIDEIEMIELHYMKNGILYKCQIVSEPVNNEEIEKGNADTPIYNYPWYYSVWNFLIKIGKFFIEDLAKLSAPEFIYGITGAVILGFSGIILIVLCISFTPQLIILMTKGIGKVIKALFVGIYNVFKYLFIGLWTIIRLPYDLIKKLINKIKN